MRLVAPGGRLVIVGMAYNKTALDWVISGCGVPPSLLIRWLRGGKRGPAGMPVPDSVMHWGEARRAARGLLPGCRFRRRLLWRYTPAWDAPDAPTPDVRQEGGP